jgi:LemA protein
MIFGYKTKPNFTVENEAQISRPPTVDFGAAPAAGAAPATGTVPIPAPAPAAAPAGG